MEKNILTCIWEGRGGREETRTSLAQVLERSWGLTCGGAGNEGGVPDRGWKAAMSTPSQQE